MSSHLPGTKPDSVQILGRILPPAQIRRFERMDRISRCVEIASDLNARHPYMEDDELGAELGELLKLLIQEKAEAQMAHFHAVDEDAAINAGRPFGVAEAPRPKSSLLGSIAAFLKWGR